MKQDFIQKNMSLICGYAAQGSTEVLEKILEQHREIINERSEKGNTLLSSACLGATPSTVKLIIDNGADLSILVKKRTALQCITSVMFDTIREDYTYFKEHKEDFYKIIELLLQKDVNLLHNNFGTDEIKEHDFLSWINNKLLEEHKDVAERIQQIVSKIVHGSPKPSTLSIVSIFKSLGQGMGFWLAPQASDGSVGPTNVDTVKKAQ